MPLEQWDNGWLGATSATNNTGELTALIEALIWLDSEAPGPDDLPASLWFNSTYAHDVLTGKAEAGANQALVAAGKKILTRVLNKRTLCWCKVKGHSDNVGNDYADHLAGQGATGQQTKHSSRWLAPVDPLLSDSCWRCNRVFTGASHARQLAGHEAYCKGPGSPPASIPCRRGCGKSFQWRQPTAGRKHHHAREFRSKHEKICRGTDAATRICPNCSLQFPLSASDDIIWQHRNRCAVTEDAPHPPTRSMWKCPQCSSRCAFTSKNEHLAVCRGSVQANRQCSKCSSIPTRPSGQSGQG